MTVTVTYDNEYIESESAHQVKAITHMDDIFMTLQFEDGDQISYVFRGKCVVTVL